ncbi:MULTISPECIES: DUF1540 domain-containing protein [Anaerosinus]|uniref:DUF1540 domain-containing protein n=1 Tax=Selenobaculum gibii TaxID=3054208 RepID=A0A9Y2AKX5_9FIRM|nr:DUF1540 domain-containing protein [Selenobaculum gbiensis]WIW71713.1 DUF1540 domain-containing protein [Selenobaculum gbiensis]
MGKIACSVDKCSHNKCGSCYANFVEIDGSKAQTDADTCCTSYLNQDTYSSLTNSCGNDSSECTCLNCRVESCEYNENCCCHRDGITVGGKNAITHSETNCLSFEAK